MPTYQYACTECDHAFEQFQSFSDDALSVCPRCEGRLRKVYNAVGVVFKGSGFYRNDSRTDGKSSNGGGAPKSPATSDSSGTGSDSSSSTPSEKSTSDTSSSNKSSSKSSDKSVTSTSSRNSPNAA